MQSQALRLLGVKGGGHGRRGGALRSWTVVRDELVTDHGYDTKYAMHCARLGFQGIELLTTRRLALPIEGEPAEWLRRVRRGEVPFAEWWARALAVDDQLGALAGDETLPAGPDRARIEAWSVATHLQVWSRAG
jgi:hypothetical protein